MYGVRSQHNGFCSSLQINKNTSFTISHLERTHISMFPELHGLHTCYSRDGWLLIQDSSGTNTFFSNPITHVCIHVARPDLSQRCSSFLMCSYIDQLCELICFSRIGYHLDKEVSNMLFSPMESSTISSTKVVQGCFISLRFRGIFILNGLLNTLRPAHISCRVPRKYLPSIQSP